MQSVDMGNITFDNQRPFVLFGGSMYSNLGISRSAPLAYEGDRGIRYPLCL